MDIADVHEELVTERHYIDGRLLAEIEALHAVHTCPQGRYVYEFRTRVFLTHDDPPVLEFRSVARPEAA